MTLVIERAIVLALPFLCLLFQWLFRRHDSRQSWQRDATRISAAPRCLCENSLTCSECRRSLWTRSAARRRHVLSPNCAGLIG